MTPPKYAIVLLAEIIFLSSSKRFLITLLIFKQHSACPLKITFYLNRISKNDDDTQSSDAVVRVATCVRPLSLRSTSYL